MSDGLIAALLTHTTVIVYANGESDRYTEVKPSDIVRQIALDVLRNNPDIHTLVVFVDGRRSPLFEYHRAFGELHCVY